MKKLIALFIILVLCLPLVACYTPEENDVKAYSFSVDYDYGMHIQGKATPLLDGSKLFFEPQDWNIDTLVGGDVITMVYTGELLIQESYPSQVATHHLDIAGISATKAELLELEVIMCEDNSPMIRAKNESLANHTVTLKSSYIIDEEQFLWIIWSQTGEVWRGRINKLGFEKQ